MERPTGPGNEGKTYFMVRAYWNSRGRGFFFPGKITMEARDVGGGFQKPSIYKRLGETPTGNPKKLQIV